MSSQMYSRYWEKKRLLQDKVPHFPVRTWNANENLSDIEKIYFSVIKNSKSILDIGAGDLRVKKKFEASGYQGEYHTQDIGVEHHHTYRDLSSINRKYDTIICFDVLEHMNLQQGLALIETMMGLVEDNGTILLQTPNAKCIRNPMSWDMTHIHCYNLQDLWALFTALGFEVQGFRVVFEDGGGLLQKFYALLGRFVITRLLGSDYADNIALIASKKRRS